MISAMVFFLKSLFMHENEKGKHLFFNNFYKDKMTT